MQRMASLRSSALTQWAMRLMIVGGMAAILMMMSTTEAHASYGTSHADSDGYIPVTHSCWAGNTLGLYDWSSNGYTTWGTVVINECALDRMGAGPMDRQRVIAHERGHGRGLAHSSNPYSVMYPVYRITGN